MNKLLYVLALTLAMNFLAIAAGVGWLYQSGHLDRQKVGTIKEIMFPATMPADTQSQSPEPTTRPSLKLEELLARQVGHPASEQVEFIQRSFDARMEELDRKQRELEALKASIDAAGKQLIDDRGKFASEQKAFDARQQEAAKLAGDKGFADALQLY